ncbi:MAG TPA: hypothetical protein EYQ64_10915 [Gemmatimonadetes bacterium]|nr:hypothetical protein [Gemmatimonadota bacterium]
MILRRYGTTVQSVETNFDSKAFTEIGFRRDHAYSSAVDDFLAGHTRVSEHLLEAASEGDVQDAVESDMLQLLLEQLQKIDRELAENEFVLVESEQGQDYPKTRTRQKNVVVEGENRLYFYSSVSPPLKVAVFRSS